HDSTTKVLIVDDHPVVREGLALRIDRQPDLEVCGEAADEAEALRCVTALKPDVAVIDISLQSGNGIDLIKRLRQRHGDVRMVVWSMYSENLYAERALHAGALGYVTKDQPTDHIIAAIRRVRDGKTYLSEAAAERLLQRAVGGNPEAAPRSEVDQLSDRELEVFRLIGMGLSTRQAAEKLHVSPKTVETYQARIKSKLGLDNAHDLIRRAVQWLAESD